MTTPNWQHHSRKEQKRKLKPQALRDARRRRQALKAKLQGGQSARSGFICEMVRLNLHSVF
jgi:hypothetical protein